jgi:hypothetical protein
LKKLNTFLKTLFKSRVLLRSRKHRSWELRSRALLRPRELRSRTLIRSRTPLRSRELRLTGTYLLLAVNPNNWYLDHSKANDLNSYLKTYLVGGEVNLTGSDLWLIPWFNSEAYHTLPPSINFLYESLLKLLLPKYDVSITVYNHPIPRDNSQDIYLVMIGLIIICLFLVPITVPFIGASYVLFPIHERISNSKLLQLMNGISPIVFWSASFIYDLFNHLIACIFIFIIFAIFD